MAKKDGARVYGCFYLLTPQEVMLTPAVLLFAARSALFRFVLALLGMIYLDYSIATEENGDSRYFQASASSVSARSSSTSKGRAAPVPVRLYAVVRTPRCVIANQQVADGARFRQFSPFLNLSQNGLEQTTFQLSLVALQSRRRRNSNGTVGRMLRRCYDDVMMML